ncbi:hypothetical protein ACMC9I_09885 [Deinococcota bacterium DY0809b]
MRAGVWMLVALLAGWALAGRIEVTQADRLELRKVGDSELVVLVGEPVILKLEKGEEVRADRVEYDRSARRLILIGQVFYQDAEGRVTEADYLELYLDDESLDALEVHIQSGGIDLWGPEATRVMGQILLTQGEFTPCARCGQDPYDYSFKARKVILYPGDRLVAYDVTVYTRGQVTFYSPVLLLHFSERRPRVEVGSDPTDGWFVSADLPYVTRNGLGFTLLRWFENRGWGLGVDHWGAGAAYEHYRALYLPPEVGAARGTLEAQLDYRMGDKNLRDLPFYQATAFKWTSAAQAADPPRWSLKAEYRLKEDGWRHEFSLERRENTASGRVRLKLSSRALGREEPRAEFRLQTYLDLGAAGPPAARTVPEMVLRWTRGWSGGGFSVKGSLYAGGYFDRTNELNRSARAAGVWASAGRIYVDHLDVFRPSPLWKGFRLSAENRFKGWYYDTGERQVDWRSTLRASQTLGGLRVEARLERRVAEGEAFFARDYIRPERKLDFKASSRWSVLPGLVLTASGGRDLEQAVYAPLKAGLEARPGPLALKLDHLYDPQEGRHRTTSGRLSLRLGDLAASAQTGYRYLDAAYDDLLLRASYALPGGNLSLTHKRDLNQGRPRETRAAFELRPGSARYSLSETYDHDGRRLNGRIGAGWGPFSVRLDHTSFFTEDPGDPNFRDHQLTLTAAWKEHRLTLLERWDGAQGRFGPGSLRFGSRFADLRSTWNVSAAWHLPETGDEEVYLEEASIKGGFDVWSGGDTWPALSVQGGFEYARYAADDRKLSFKDFGFTLGWRGEENTRLYLSALLTQEVRTSEGWPPLEPRFVVTLDRCCWALRFTLDAAAPSARIAFLYGDQSARFLFDESGIRMPWEGGL